MSNDILLIINPNASKGKGKKKAKKIKEYFSKKGRFCTVAFTQGRGHAEKLAKSGVESGFKTILVAGGDGSVNEVINGLMRAKNRDKVALGIIPIGRGNDFAWIAGIPNNVEKACKIILEGNREYIDVGFAKGTERERGRYFLNGMGFGFEPMVNFKAQSYKHLNGMISYLVAFMNILFNPPKGYSLELNIDGEVFSVKTQQLSVNNGRRMGSAFLMTPKAEINDGLLDIMFTKKIFKGLGLINLVIHFLRGAMVSDKINFEYRKAKHITIKALSNVVVSHIDGEEFTRKGKYFDIEIVEKGIKLFRQKKC